MTKYRNHAEEIADIRALLETERLFPNHVPPGKAAPRTVDNTDRDDARPFFWWFVQDVICVGTAIVLLAGSMIFAAIQSPDLSEIPEYTTIED